MMRVSITVTEDTATPAAQRLARAIRPSQLATIVSRTGAALYVSHFERLAAERHRSGVKAVAHNFYAEAARSTLGTHSGGTATITVSAIAAAAPAISTTPLSPAGAAAAFTVAPH